MPDPTEFDRFYAGARDRLLLQTYALTGDLPAAKSAVRDAFVAAWHHWRKVGKREDPESWVRPHAWNHAQRLHTARVWHRDKSLHDDVRATLDALSRLSANQRRVLLLTQMTSTSMEETAREVGLTDELAAQELQTASAQFAIHRDVPSTTIRQHLEALSLGTEGTRFPRATIIRRSGSARRRSHTVIGLAAAVATVVVGGQLVHASGGASAILADENRDRPTPPPIPALQVDELLPQAEAAALLPKRNLGESETSDNTEGDGRHIACQEARYADPRGYDALVRTWKARGKPSSQITQSIELSRTTKAAERSFETVLSWFGGCQEKRFQLISTQAPVKPGIGDDARVLLLRDWTDPITTYTVGVVRTGDITSTLIRKVKDPKTRADDYPDLKPMATAMLRSVEAVCGNDGAGKCVPTGTAGSTDSPGSTGGPSSDSSPSSSGPSGSDPTRSDPTSSGPSGSATADPSPAQAPKLVAADPPRAAQTPGGLQVVDLPPINQLIKRWAATKPVKPRVNPAASRCDDAKFTGPAIKNARSRTFLIPGAKVGPAFGLSQTSGRFRSPKAAKAFVRQITGGMNGCEDRDLATTLEQVADRPTASTDLKIWHVTTEISDEQTVRFFMGVVRTGSRVSQIGFMPSGDRTMREQDFLALVERAQQRLPLLGPQKGKKSGGSSSPDPSGGPSTSPSGDRSGAPTPSAGDTPTN